MVNSSPLPIDGIIFDLDGTLLDSALDFDLIRCEMGLPTGQPILESLAALPTEEADRCYAILHRHEQLGAERAVALPGVIDFLTHVQGLGLRQAIVTRNSRPVATTMLAKLPFAFDPVITREDGPVKPDPWAIREICKTWQVSPSRVMMIGDYWFDVASGQAAGAKTALYVADERSRILPEHVRPDFVLECFSQWRDLWNWLSGD